MEFVELVELLIAWPSVVVIPKPNESAVLELGHPCLRELPHPNGDSEVPVQDQ